MKKLLFSDKPRLLAGIFALMLTSPAVQGKSFQLGNGVMTADFDDAGLLRLSAKENPQILTFTGDAAAISIEGKSFTTLDLEQNGVRQEKESLTYTYALGNGKLEVIYELKPDWHFVSKQVKLTLPKGATSRIDSVTVFAAEMKTPVAEEIVANHVTGAVFLRLGDDPKNSRSTAFLTLQNPFLQWERKDGKLALSYAPEMDWRALTVLSSPIGSASD